MQQVELLNCKEESILQLKQIIESQAKDLELAKTPDEKIIDLQLRTKQDVFMETRKSRVIDEEKYLSRNQSNSVRTSSRKGGCSVCRSRSR